MFMLEAAPASRRMLFSSWQIASQNLGSLASGLIGFLLAQVLTQSSFNAWGWRVPFAIGVLIAPVGFYIRTQLVETLDRSRLGATTKDRCILGTVVQSHWRGILLGVALISGGTITQYFLINLTPYAIRTLHLPDATAMVGSMTLGITGGLGALAGGFLADRWGMRAIVIIPRILLMLALFPAMRLLVASPSAVTLATTILVLTLLQAMSAAVSVMLIPLIFPPAVRATGLAIAYSLGVAIFGGTATYIVTWLVGFTGNPLAATYYVFAANVVLLLAVLAVPRIDYALDSWPPPLGKEV
jgi:MFS family permease